MSEKLTPCRWYQDEFCVNADCPYCADYCPVTEYPQVCKYRTERTGRWIADNDTLRCSECGFGYFPHGYFFHNGECIGSLVFDNCPHCKSHMTAGAKEDKPCE